MSRYIAFAYGVGAYGIFFLTFLYLVGFLANLVVPKGIDDGVAASTGAALLVNLGLVALFGIQHSVMARPAFKRWWTSFVPPVVERSSFVLVASLMLILLFWQWQPMPQVIWEVTADGGITTAWALFCAGFALVLLATFVVDHFDLFGLKQVTLNLMQKAYHHPAFKVTWFYKFVRHPIYLGFLLAFWSTPRMTLGHLIFALGMSGYILIGIHYEERDLETFFGDDYRRYRERVPMLIPTAKAHETIRQRPAHGSGHG